MFECSDINSGEECRGAAVCIGDVWRKHRGDSAKRGVGRVITIAGR